MDVHYCGGLLVSCSLTGIRCRELIKCACKIIALEDCSKANLSCYLVHIATTQQTQNICITFVQCWTNVKDVGPTLYKSYTNVLCLLGKRSVCVLTRLCYSRDRLLSLSHKQNGQSKPLPLDSGIYNTLKDY